MQSFFGHFLVIEFFNSHSPYHSLTRPRILSAKACFRQLVPMSIFLGHLWSRGPLRGIFGKDFYTAHVIALGAFRKRVRGGALCLFFFLLALFLSRLEFAWGYGTISNKRWAISSI